MGAPYIYDISRLRVKTNRETRAWSSTSVITTWIYEIYFWSSR